LELVGTEDVGLGLKPIGVGVVPRVIPTDVGEDVARQIGHRQGEAASEHPFNSHPALPSLAGVGVERGTLGLQALGVLGRVELGRWGWGNCNGTRFCFVVPRWRYGSSQPIGGFIECEAAYVSDERRRSR
jgi:hypothetical protein